MSILNMIWSEYDSYSSLNTKCSPKIHHSPGLQAYTPGPETSIQLSERVLSASCIKLKLKFLECY